jgi:hypothetical protein
MTREELQTILDRNNVPTKYYSFDGAGGGDVWALERLDPGWSLSYYDQRGEREENVVLATEEEGCLALFDRLARVIGAEEGRAIQLVF